MEKEWKFYTVEEIKNILLSDERLVYADNGIDECIVKYSDLPDFIMDMANYMHHDCVIKVYPYPPETMTPILTTRGCFLDKCNPDVRVDIIDRLAEVHIFENMKDYKIINESDFELASLALYKDISVKVSDFWLSDHGDIRCNATISINGKDKANFITSFDRDDYPDWKNSQNDYEDGIKENWEKYLHLPKLSKCSKLMQKLYDNVCESEATMCHITDDDWKEYYADRFSDRDIDKLKKEIKKYQLDDVITFDNSAYKMVCWGDLETSFNDDRKLVRDRDIER